MISYHVEKNVSWNMNAFGKFSERIKISNISRKLLKQTHKLQTFKENQTKR
jgi:hypothetical protein